jgi:hypothetical protein
MDKNEFFNDKPEWFKGYATTIANYLVLRDRVTMDKYGRSDRSSLSIHFDTCAVAEIFDMDEMLDSDSMYDSYGDFQSSPICFVSARVDCECGEYKNARVSKTGTIAETIAEAFWVTQ